MGSGFNEEDNEKSIDKPGVDAFRVGRHVGRKLSRSYVVDFVRLTRHRITLREKRGDAQSAEVV